MARARPAAGRVEPGSTPSARLRPSQGPSLAARPDPKPAERPGLGGPVEPDGRHSARAFPRVGAEVRWAGEGRPARAGARPAHGAGTARKGGPGAFGAGGQRVLGGRAAGGRHGAGGGGRDAGRPGKEVAAQGDALAPDRRAGGGGLDLLLDDQAATVEPEPAGHARGRRDEAAGKPQATALPRGDPGRHRGLAADAVPHAGVAAVGEHQRPAPAPAREPPGLVRGACRRCPGHLRQQPRARGEVAQEGGGAAGLGADLGAGAAVLEDHRTAPAISPRTKWRWNDR